MSMNIGARVEIDGDSLDPLCPWHGPQIGAPYEPGRAPCGCLWVLDKRGILRAIQAGDSLRSETTVRLQKSE